jgi:hypothetical protein
MSALAHLDDCRQMASQFFAICSLAHGMHSRMTWASSDTHWAGCTKFDVRKNADARSWIGWIATHILFRTPLRPKAHGIPY